MIVSSLYEYLPRIRNRVQIRIRPVCSSLLLHSLQLTVKRYGKQEVASGCGSTVYGYFVCS